MYYYTGTKDNLDQTYLRIRINKINHQKPSQNRVQILNQRTCVWKEIKGDTASNKTSCVIHDSLLIRSENLKRENKF